MARRTFSWDVCHALNSTNCGQVGSSNSKLHHFFCEGNFLLRWRGEYLPLTEYGKYSFRLVTRTLEGKRDYRNVDYCEKATKQRRWFMHTLIHNLKKFFFYNKSCASAEIWLACAGLLPAELEFFMGTRRSRATFQPCWCDAASSLEVGTVPGSTFSFPTEIQGHQSLCWARGSNVFLWRSSSWNKNVRKWFVKADWKSVI